MSGKNHSLFIHNVPYACSYQQLVTEKNGRVTDSVFLDANSEFRRIFNMPDGPLEGTRAFEAIPMAREYFNWENVFTRAAEGNLSEIIPLSDRIGGRYYSVVIFSTMPGCFFTILRDRTEEKENSLRLEKQRSEIDGLNRDIEIIFNNTPEALFLLEFIGGQYRYIRSNYAHQKLTGLTQEEIRGKTPSDLLGPTIGGAMMEHIELAAKNPDGISYNDIMSLPIVRGRFFLNRLIPVMQHGRARFIIGSRSDITEIKQLAFEKEELAKSMFSVFNENSAMVLILESGSLNVIDANPAARRFFDFEEGEAEALRACDLFLLPKEKFGELSDVRPGVICRSFIASYMSPDSGARQIEIFTSPVIYQGGSCVCCIIFDVTEREKIREELTQERNLLSVTLDSIGDGVVAVDKKGLISVFNREAQRLTGWNEDEARGRPFSDVFRLGPDITGGPVPSPIEDVLRNGKASLQSAHSMAVSRDGRTLPVSDSASPIKDETGRLYGAVMVFRDVSLDREREETITFLSYHDELTGLYNRRFAETEIKRLDTSRNLPFSIILGDVNGLKLTNDIFGHQAGDTLLKRAAQVMGKCCRADDLVARWGGDEYVILLPHTGAKQARELVDRINDALYNENCLGRHISISLGCATKETEDEDIQNVIRFADKRMYRCKLNGGRAYRMAIIGMLPTLMNDNIHEMKGHCERLKNLCGRMGEKAGLKSAELEKLLLLCGAHDIGMVSVRKELFYKKGSLSSEEEEEIREHTSIGYRIAQGAQELQPVADYILCHHELWDGSGYPRRLFGPEIPRLVRMFSAANFYDTRAFGFGSITAVGEKAAYEEAVREAGRMLDPEMVKLFASVMRDGAKKRERKPV